MPTGTVEAAANFPQHSEEAVAADTCQRPAVHGQIAAPAGRWRWSQQWRDVLFLHWPAEARELRHQLPAGLEVDTYDGQAWVSYVAFRLQGVRLHGWPALPFCSQLLELNFRTYVCYRGEPAICFLTMHADHRWMIAAAKLLTPLPYELARLSHTTDDVGGEFLCQPRPEAPPLLSASFQFGNDVIAEPGSLVNWLTERYVAYVGTRQGLQRMQVFHAPWLLRTVELHRCAYPADLHGDPLCHFSAGVSSLLGRFESV